MGEVTIARILDRGLARRPDAPAVIARSGTLTYAQLDAAAGAAAGALGALGVRPGDVVAACLPNDLDIVVAFHGTQRIGAVWAGIGEALAPAEQRAQAATVRPRVLLAGPRCQISSEQVNGAFTTVKPNAWASLLAARHPVPGWHADQHAPAGIAFSSGTTGAPKAIVHSQHGLLLPARVLAETRGYGPDLVKGDSFPLTIVNMQVLSTLLVALAGGTAVVMDRRDAAGLAEWITRHRVTLWNGAPAQVLDLARRPDADLGSLTEVWSGGGDCPEYVRKAFEKAHGVPVSPAYGLSEAPTVVSIDPVSIDPLSASGKPAGHKDSAAGRVLPHLDVAAYDDQGRRLSPGEQGELGIRAAVDGPWAEAWRGPLDGSSSPHDNSKKQSPLLTGDVGSVDAEGWLTMTDRKKLLIVRGGANVSPAEVERVLHEHPRVARAVVFGVPDERLGERVAALLVTAEPVAADGCGNGESRGGEGPGGESLDGQSRGGSLDRDSLRDFCAARLARYKIPDAWGLVPALPVNAMNKVVRTDLPDALRAARPL